jgi:hypothetical protein
MDLVMFFILIILFCFVVKFIVCLMFVFVVIGGFSLVAATCVWGGCISYQLCFVFVAVDWWVGFCCV